MKKNTFKKIILGLILISLAVVPFISLGFNIIDGGNLDGPPERDRNSIFTTINKIGNLIYGLLMAAAAISIILAAYNFLTAQGEPDKVKSARMYVIYALVGVLVATLSLGLIKLIEGLSS